MKISCDRGELNAAIQMVIRATAVKNPMQILEGIRLEAGQNSVKLTGFDLRKAIFTQIEANVREIGSIVLNGKTLAGIVSAMPAGTVEIECEGTNTSLKCGKSKFNIIGMDAADYPELPEMSSADGIEIPRNVLSKMIGQTMFALSTDEVKPLYMGELFEIKDGKISTVATDGYRISLRRENVESDGEARFVVPGYALSDLEKLCGTSDSAVKVVVMEKHIGFVFEESTLISLRLVGDFLNYERAIPKEFSVTGTVDKLEMQQAIQRVALVVDDKILHPLICEVDSDYIHFSCATPTGKADDYCQIDGNDKEMKIGFNSKYLLDAVKAAPAEEIKFCLKSPSSPGVILPADGSDSFTYLILPVRMKGESQ